MKSIVIEICLPVVPINRVVESGSAAFHLPVIPIVV